MKKIVMDNSSAKGSTKNGKNKKQTLTERLLGKKSTRPTVVLAYAAVCTFIATIIFGIYQHSDSTKSLAISDNSIALTKRSIEFSEKNFAIQNRPWVMVDFPIAMEESGGGFVDANTLVNVTIRNIGKTPAESVQVLAKIVFSESFSTMSQRDKQFIGIIAPTGFTIFPVQYRGPQRVITRNEGEGALYLVGRITYGGNDTTDFCGVYNLGNRKFTPTKRLNRMR